MSLAMMACGKCGTNLGSDADQLVEVGADLLTLAMNPDASLTYLRLELRKLALVCGGLCSTCAYENVRRAA